MKLLDSKVGDVLWFHYTPETGTIGNRLVKVDDLGSYYVIGIDLQKNEPRTYNDYRAKNVEVVAQKNEDVKPRKDVLEELAKDGGWKMPESYPGQKLCNVLLAHFDDHLSSAKYHEPSDSLILKYKEKPKVEERLEVDVDQNGYNLTFFNQENKKVSLSYSESNKEFILVDDKDSRVSNPTVRNLVDQLNELFK
jgi:hypothetical protein